ncbi:HepT-like ribonuclease domain-containing protein [Turneriella parva]|uniref:DUF86 domain-containing protein n=1 Tax=Turneriella parva (strain ATCC BAA-1111 / DSM 21527 / NCTC 11395 / H) TaxID=869212 RepID=I4B546_TURPD|nr:DUF86 domain-containing protein [Turneriella parva]AFM12403.1 protein of unknown function DUF86 [Turneriella parva DSM 21527]
MKSDFEYLGYILGEIDFLEKELKAITESAFLTSEIHKRATARSLEIIGEAVKTISPGLKSKYPEIPWRLIAGTRDKLIHGYFIVDYKIVWDAATNKLPALKPQLKEIRLKEKDIFQAG